MQRIAARDEPGAASWLPDFCSVGVLLALLAVAELVVLIVLLAPNRQGALDPGRIFVDSVFVQWLALCCALALCRLRMLIGRVRVIAVGVALAYACVIGIVAIGSALVYWLDQALGLGLTVAEGGPLHFIGGSTAITALVTAAAFRYFYVRAQWQRGVQAQARAQVAALQARIRPHFLFNSMNTIASLIRSRPDDAERAVEDLGDLFRAALAPGDSLSTLGDELDLMRRYIAIEKLRFGERLTLDWKVDQVPCDLPMPGLLLQPLAENAVLHGIQGLAAGGTIEVTAGVEPDRVSISVRNPRPREPQRMARGNRSALDNIRQRLAFHYGERGRLEVDDSAGYYSATLTIPRA